MVLFVMPIQMRCGHLISACVPYNEADGADCLLWNVCSRVSCHPRGPCGMGGIPWRYRPIAAMDVFTD